MNDVASLQASAQIQHSAVRGVLHGYQDRLADRHQQIIFKLEACANSIASEAAEFIQRSISTYQNEHDSFAQEKEQLFEDLISVDADHEMVKQRIIEGSQTLVDMALQLRQECFSKYDSSFLELKPMIEESFQQCEEFRMLLPESLIEKLPFTVKRLNRQYLINKKELTEKLFINEIASREEYDQTIQMVEEKEEIWRANKLEQLNNDTKLKLDYKYPIDYGTIFEDFERDEQKFIKCYDHAFTNFKLLFPPEKFDREDFADWYKDALEIIDLQQNFINKFKKLIEEKIQEREEVNNNIIEDMKSQISQWKTEEEVTKIIAWLLPIKNLTTKVNTEFMNRLGRYWDNRINALRQIFNKINEFMTKVLDSYYGLPESVESENQKCKEKLDQYDKELQDKLANLEDQINTEVEKINGAVNEQEIQQLVENCKKNFNQIEEEYRAFYSKSISTLDEQPITITEFYDDREEELLESFKLLKTYASDDDPRKIARETRNDPKKNQKVDPKKSGRRGSPSRSTRASTRNTSRMATAKRGGKNDTKKGNQQKEKRVPLPDGYNFQIEESTKYEEFETLELIDPVPDFPDEPEEEIIETKGRRGSARGKSPPRKSPPKKPPPKKAPAKKGKKPIEPEPEELEMPEIKLFDMIPIINEKPAITIFIPLNDEVADFVNPLRKAVFSEFNRYYSNAMKEAEFTALRNKLVEQLNTRLRDHSPRVGNLTLNIGQARLTKLQNTKKFIENHFRQTAANINSEFKTILSHIQEKANNLKLKCESLHKMTEQLPDLKQTRNFNQMQSNFRIEDKKFATEYERFNESINMDIEKFIHSYNAVKERFSNTISDFSEDEKQYCESMNQKMDKQVEEVSAQLKQMLANINSEIEKTKTDITNEFEEVLPIHKSDVSIIESLNKSLNNAKAKYESLKFKNHQSEHEVSNALELLNSVTTGTSNPNDYEDINDLSPEAAINKQFETIDLVRLLIVKRAKYLGILKSKMSAEPILVNLDFSVRADSDEQSNSKKKLTRQRSKKKTEGSSFPTSSDSVMDFDISINSQIKQIGKDLVEEMNTYLNPYYNGIKKRKIQITRPDDIPETQKECQNKILERWNEITEDSKEIISQSSETLTHQINESIRITRDTVTKIYQNVLIYFQSTTASGRAELQSDFEEKIKKLNEQRNQLKLRLVPQLSDSNKENEFKDLMKEEIEREIEEKKVIDSFNDSVMDYENNMMKTFLIHLPSITKYALSMFDNFVMNEDLVTFKVVNAERVSMKQMLLNMKRNEGDKPFSENRPAFRMRKWPQLNAVMSSMDFMTAAQSPRINESTSRKIKKLTTKKIMDAAVEKLPPLESLDTGLSRGAIVEEEKCYISYENALSERIENYREVVEQARAKSDELNKNWRVCSLKLQPNYIFEPV